MNLLEYFAVGLLYLPFIATPLLMIYWYAFVKTPKNERERDGNESREEREEP
ncbi:MAG: hypothetical protein L0220_20405 [Acidobacteria bacterium]|nr:hypothetical protein [Acidobacteriota bacterium]